MRVKKNEWKKRKDMIGVLVIRVPLRSDPINVPHVEAKLHGESKMISLFVPVITLNL